MLVRSILSGAGYILDKPFVGGVIVGGKVGVSQHIQDNKKRFNFNEDQDDLNKIDSISN